MSCDIKYNKIREYDFVYVMVFSIYFRLLEVIDRINKLIDSSPNSVNEMGLA